MKSEIVVSQTVAFPSELRQKLIKRAKQEGITISALVQRALVKELRENIKREKMTNRDIVHVGPNIAPNQGQYFENE